MVIPPNEPETTQHSATRAFSIGHDGKRPTADVVSMADRIARAAADKTVEPEITVDADGALSFDLRLTSGWLVLAELDLNGALDASTYDDRQGILIKRLPQATDSELVAWFQS